MTVCKVALERLKLWRAVWGKSQRATNIHFALLFTLFRTKSRHSRGPLDLRNFVVSAQKLETRSATLSSQRNSFDGERNYSGWAQHFIRGDYGIMYIIIWALEAM